MLIHPRVCLAAASVSPLLFHSPTLPFRSSHPSALRGATALIRHLLLPPSAQLSPTPLPIRKLAAPAKSTLCPLVDNRLIPSLLGTILHRSLIDPLGVHPAPCLHLPKTGLPARLPTAPHPPESTRSPVQLTSRAPRPGPSLPPISSRRPTPKEGNPQTPQQTPLPRRITFTSPRLHQCHQTLSHQSSLLV